MPLPTLIQVTDNSQIGEIRRTAQRLGEIAGLDEVRLGRLSIVATELGTNCLRHAVRATIVLQASTTVAGPAVDLLSLDHGPGISSIEKAMRDGYSTAGTPGTGLGALKRLSDEFDIYSQPEHGTAVFSRIMAREDTQHRTGLTAWSGICTPIRNETECGDAWGIIADAGRFQLMVADGLGHGPDAAKASTKAIEVLQQCVQQLPAAILQTAHQRLSGTRGAAVAVAVFLAADSLLKYAGIGNISGTLISPSQKRGLFSHNGMIGNLVRKVQEFDYACGPGDLIIMHSDGLQTHWSLEPYPGLLTRHPGIIAGILYRDFQRGRDDTSVVVVKIGTANGQSA